MSCAFEIVDIKNVLLREGTRRAVCTFFIDIRIAVIGGHDDRYGGGVGAPPKGEVGRDAIAGRRVREHPLEKVGLERALKKEALLAARLLRGTEIELCQ